MGAKMTIQLSTFLPTLFYYQGQVMRAFGPFLVFLPLTTFPGPLASFGSYVNLPREVVLCRNWGSILFSFGHLLITVCPTLPVETQKEIAAAVSVTFASMAFFNFYAMSTSLNGKYAKDRAWVQFDGPMFAAFSLAYGVGAYFAE